MKGILKNPYLIAIVLPSSSQADRLSTNQETSQTQTDKFPRQRLSLPAFHTPTENILAGTVKDTPMIYICLPAHTKTCQDSYMDPLSIQTRLACVACSESYMSLSHVWETM